jgi:serine/threonine-protein kinase
MKSLDVNDRLDQYVISDVLAITITATVFKGHDSETGRLVCIKVPHPQCENDPHFCERFAREARILGRLHHPNVVRGVDPGAASRLYLVTEFVEGQSLRSLLAAGPLPVERALAIARQICSALAYLDEQKVVHRDVKPENVLLTSDGSVKLIDFGIALDRTARRLTHAGRSRTIGTPDYMSPEQIKGHRGDARSDTYAAGVLLYEMLTGALPFANDDAFTHTEIIEEFLPPTYYRPNLDPNLSMVVCKAIAVAPRQRYQSATDLVRCLCDPPACDETAAMGGAARTRSPGPLGRRLLMTAVLAVLASFVWVSHQPSPARAHVEATAISR